MEMVNGYVFLDLTKANVYAKALKVLGTDKPVVIKDGSGSPYFVDSLTLDGTNVVITKGGKTITIANDNTITSVGNIQNHLYQYYFDGNDDANESIFVNVTTSINFDNLSELLNYLTTKDYNFYCGIYFEYGSSNTNFNFSKLTKDSEGVYSLYDIYNEKVSTHTIKDLENFKKEILF